MQGVQPKPKGIGRSLPLDPAQSILISGEFLSWVFQGIPIINFLSSGYNLKVMKEAIENKSEMPPWGDWGNFFVRGLIAFIISLIYLLIPIIVLLVSLGGIVFGIISGALSGDKSMAIGAIGGAIGGIFISLVLMIIFGFLIPMALAMYIKEDNISAAFRFGELLSRIRSVFGEYLTVYIVLIVLSFVLGLFGAVPILGFFILI